MRTAVLVSLVGTGVSASVGQAGAKIGEKVAVAALKRLPGATLTKINRAVGSRLLTKFGTTTIDALFAEEDRKLPRILEEAARLGAQLLMQAAPGGQFLTLVLTAYRDQVDRWDVAGDAVDGAMQAVVERVDVAAGQAASGGDDVFGGER